MHTPYMCTPPPLPVCVSRACRGVLSRVPSHVYVFPLTVVTCPLTSVTCDFFSFFNLAGRMHDLGVYEKQKKCRLRGESRQRRNDKHSRPGLPLPLPEKRVSYFVRRVEPDREFGLGVVVHFAGERCSRGGGGVSRGK